jgi:hypothetical protein
MRSEMKRKQSTHRITRLDRQHSDRFRWIDNNFASVVASAYGGDIARAAKDSDEQVFALVRAWEIKESREPLDWEFIGEMNAAADEDLV